MNPNRLLMALVALGLPWFAYASSETQQYCNEMYPADSYDAADRSFYVQECLQAYGDASGTEEGAVVDATAEAEEVPYYEGTVEEFIEEQPAADEYAE